jgi:hypothetical protein
MDKQGRVLQKWEAHVRELQAGPAAISNPAIDALAAWAGVSSKARQAMKRAGPSLVQAIEAQLLDFLVSSSTHGRRWRRGGSKPRWPPTTCTTVSCLAPRRPCTE